MVPGESATQSPAPGSIWQLKPWWCQPWSILLSGAAGIGGSWVVLQRWWITAAVAVAVGLWWLMFLVLVPAAYRQQQAQSPVNTNCAT